MTLRARLLFAAFALLAGSCGAVERSAADRFTATGELIAVSGGDAGAAHACVVCHGLDGRGNGAGSPRLAGLDQGYLAAQLEGYASGRRRHPEMERIARKLTLAQQQAVSAYYAAVPFKAQPRRAAARGDAAQLYHHGDPARGLAACAACHGALGEGTGPGSPPLGGQPAAYLAEQIDQWRSARRRNDPENIMLRISQRLSPSESGALADYAAALPGDLPHPGSREASPAARRGDPRNDASALPRRGGE